METLANFLHTWRLKLSTEKNTSTPFHLSNREAQRQLAIRVNGNILPHGPQSKYLGVKLDRQLTHRQLIKDLLGKVTARNNLIRCLARSTWGAKTTILRTAALAIVFSAAEYVPPVWERSIHTKKLDVLLNDTMRITTGCLKPTLTHLPVLSGIAPAKPRRESATRKISRQAWAVKNALCTILCKTPKAKTCKSERCSTCQSEEFCHLRVQVPL